MVSAIIMLWTCIYTGKRNQLDRFDAAIMIATACAYFVWLFTKL